MHALKTSMKLRVDFLRQEKKTYSEKWEWVRGEKKWVVVTMKEMQRGLLRVVRLRSEILDGRTYREMRRDEVATRIGR